MFQQNHRTADGKTLLLAQMEDEHLLNMIGAVVSWAERATGQFLTIVAETQDAARMTTNGAAITRAHRKMYGLPDPPTLHEASDQYGRGMNALAAKLEPYLLEAWTRQLGEADQGVLDELRGRWREAVGRESALASPERDLLLAPPEFQDEGDVPF